MERGSENRVVAVPSFFTRPTLATNSSTAISVVLTRIAVFKLALSLHVVFGLPS